MILEISPDFYGLRHILQFHVQQNLEKKLGICTSCSNTPFLTMGEGVWSQWIQTFQLIWLDFPGDIQSVLFISLPIYTSEFQRYPESSHKLKNLIPKRACLLGIYCLSFTLPLCSKSYSPILMSSEFLGSISFLKFGKQRFH